MRFEEGVVREDTQTERRSGTCLPLPLAPTTNLSGKAAAGSRNFFFWVSWLEGLFVEDGWMTAVSYDYHD